MDNAQDLGPTARKPLHFFVLADCSGSMFPEKIAELNQAMREVIPLLKDNQRSNILAEIYLRVLVFSDTAQWHNATPTKITEFDWTDLTADGFTAMGDALRKLKKEGLDPETVGRRAVKPVVLLLSDGAPTDDWEQALKEFNADGFGKPGRLTRVAIAIGKDAKKDVLTQFTENVEMVFTVKNGQQLISIIKVVSVQLTNLRATATINNGGDAVQAVADAVKVAQGDAGWNDVNNW